MFIVFSLGTIIAIYLSEYASHPVREVVKPILEVLAGIPSVVFGYLAVVTVSPFIRHWFPSAGVFNAASASIVVGFMILPMVVSLSEDILRSVPVSLREAAYALGATKLSITDIFRFPTLSALAAHLDGAPKPTVAAVAPSNDRADARNDAMARRRAMRAGRVDA